MSDELKRFKVTEEVDCSEEDSVLFRETLSEEDKILWDIVWNNGSPINIFIKWGWKIEDGYQALLDRFKRSIEINEIAKKINERMAKFYKDESDAKNKRRSDDCNRECNLLSKKKGDNENV